MVTLCNGTKGVAHDNMITHCTITLHDLSNAYTIFGPDFADIRRKTVRQKLEWVTIEYINMLQDLLTKLRVTMLMGDVMLVYWVPFFVTFGQGIGLLTLDFALYRIAKLLPDNL